MTKENLRIEQKIFSESYTNKLFIDLKESENYHFYNLDDFPSKEEHPSGGTRIYIPEEISLLSPKGNDKKDFENTKIIFELFRDLTPTQASDHRLWTYLTHVTFWDYMKKRWPVEDKEKSQKLNYIKERYFLLNLNLRTLTHNGISRLWWFGYLTHDADKSNPWELTEILLKSQDLPTSLMERALGSNENIRVGVLEFFKENPGYINSKSIQQILKMLNLVGGVKNLPFLDSQEIKEILYTIDIAA